MNFRSIKPEEPEINLIPFIDVLLVILIFLMISTTFNRYAELQIELPQAEANPTKIKKNQLVVAVDSKGVYSINGKAIAVRKPKDLALKMRQLMRRFKMRNPSVDIYADALAPHQYVVNIMEAARLNNLNRIAFSTKQ